MHRILCVEDSKETHVLLKAALHNQELVFADSLKSALEILSKHSFSLLLIDIGLPDGTGIDLLANLQEKLENTGVIFLTGKQDLATKLAAFSLGADDFIAKPFDPMELRIRVDAKLKKLTKQTGATEVIKVGGIVCNLQEQRIYKSNSPDAPLELTALEFRIFQLLARTPNKVFSRAEILDRVWGDSVTVNDRAVDVHVSNLRKKLANYQCDVSIETMIGTGYKLTV